MDIKFSMSEADVTRPETTANRIGRAMSGGLYRWPVERQTQPACRAPPVNPIKTHYENVNDKTLQATGDSSAFLHRYREEICARDAM